MPFPLQGLQTDIAMQLAICSRGMANSLNPLDHPWNFDSATVAKHRLRAVVALDRAACPAYRWVRAGLREIRGSWLAPSRRIYESGKPRYRMERRR